MKLKLYENFDELSEGKFTIEDIQKDLDRFNPGGGGSDSQAELRDERASKDFRDLGNWENDEEAGYEHEEDGDMDWREDDDNMIWEPGEYKKYFDIFVKWAESKPWFSNVKLGLETSEKNWVEFSVTLI